MTSYQERRHPPAAKYLRQETAVTIAMTICAMTIWDRNSYDETGLEVT